VKVNTDELEKNNHRWKFVFFKKHGNIFTVSVTAHTNEEGGRNSE
jgi:hypothetical protein